MSITNILVMTVTFLLLGIFIYVIAISQTALGYLEQQVQLSVFFKDDFTEQNISDIKTKLQNDARVSSVKYISKEDAFKIFSEINKDEPILLQSISPSILPASIEIKTKDIANLSPLADELSKTAGVEEVRFFRDVVQKFKLWSGIIYGVGFGLVALFFVISYSVVVSTLRTTIHSKGVELEIMKLVGATDRYVKNPLMYQGMLFAVTSACISGILLLLVGLVLNRTASLGSGFTFGFLHDLRIKPLIFALFMFATLIISGLVLGFLASISAVKKYLKY